MAQRCHKEKQGRTVLYMVEIHFLCVFFTRYGWARTGLFGVFNENKKESVLVVREPQSLSEIYWPELDQKGEM